jgi:hypothetical protein
LKFEVLDQINDKFLIAKKCNVTILIEVGNGFTIIIICDEITSFSLNILSLGLQFKIMSSKPFQHNIKKLWTCNDTKK